MHPTPHQNPTPRFHFVISVPGRYTPISTTCTYLAARTHALTLSAVTGKPVMLRWTDNGEAQSESVKVVDAISGVR